MAKIPYASIDQAPEKIREFFSKVEAGGRVLNVQKMIAHSPGTVREFIRFGNALLRKAALNPYFRELAIIRISFFVCFRYEWAQHVPIALSVGMTREQLEEIDRWPESARFSDADRVILAFTDEVVRQHQPSEETFARAQRLLDPTSLVELTLSIGFWSMVGKFLRTFQVEIEDSLLQDLEGGLPDNRPA